MSVLSVSLSATVSSLSLVVVPVPVSISSPLDFSSCSSLRSCSRSSIGRAISGTRFQLIAWVLLIDWDLVNSAIISIISSISSSTCFFQTGLVWTSGRSMLRSTYRTKDPFGTYSGESPLWKELQSSREWFDKMLAAASRPERVLGRGRCWSASMRCFLFLLSIEFPDDSVFEKAASTLVVFVPLMEDGDESVLVAAVAKAEDCVSAGKLLLLLLLAR
mmetsp:Transcript_2553/g.5935  ORF Transcript_2553/g.5935 Transcript_2553/m.5935 type:complete len:218 (+) Transcript_2553:880-1533(+)